MLALVIILGVLIVLALGALIGGAVMGLARRPEPAAPYRETVLAPRGRIESTEINGNRILVKLSGPDGEELIVLDANSGRLIGRVHINAQP